MNSQKLLKFSEWVEMKSEGNVQYAAAQLVLMTLKYTLKKPLKDTPIDELAEILISLGKVPDGVSPLRFSAMVKSVARDAA